VSISRHQAVGAYRRWEPEDFDAPEGSASPAAVPGDFAPAQPAGLPATAPAHATQTPVAPPPEAPAPAPAPAPELPPDFHLPTAAEIERMHDEMRRAGFEEGRVAGHAEGLEAGRVAGHAEGRARAEAEAARLARLADGLDEALRELDGEIAEQLMALAIEMARRMVKLTLAEHPESILDTVRSALLQLPQGHAHIQLHPDDLALVREHLGEQLAHAGHRLQEDPRLQRGECRVDGQGAQVDATLETRWRRVLESIGHEHARWHVEEDEADAGEATAAVADTAAPAVQPPA
jgi:flagellar assembly protein FliH